MKTEADLRMISDVATVAESPQSLDERHAPQMRQGVVAVIVERDDGTCALRLLGESTNWPSVAAAKHAVAGSSDQVAWRETTPGVWVARADGCAPPAGDRTPARRRRPEASTRSAGASVGSHSYNAALVLRRTASS
jgi:hypothetical protein